MLNILHIFSRIQLIAIIGSFAFLLAIFELIRRKKLKEAYAMIWLIMGMFFIILTFRQHGLGLLSRFCGIFYAPAFLFLILLITLTIILIQFSVVISRQADKMKLMAQEIAILKEQLTTLSQKADSCSPKRFDRKTTTEPGEEKL